MPGFDPSSAQPVYDSSTTPEDYFGAVRSIYPNARMTSGGRSPQHNAAVGGVPDSMHTTNQALDFQVPGVPGNQVLNSLRTHGLPETEALNEGNHLHVGWRPRGGNPTPQGFDPSSATPVNGGGFDPTSATPVAPARAPGATGFGMVGQTIGDLFNPNHATHDPNSLEHAIMGANGVVQQTIANSPFMNGVPGPQRIGSMIADGIMGTHSTPPPGYMPGDTPGVRDVMERLGVGRQHGESDASLHQRYNDAVTQARQQGTAIADANKIGSYAPGASVGSRAARFGQQALNTVSGLAASPQYLLAPGMGIGPNMATRIATATVGNAGLGSVSDAAAQIMDMAEGQQKDFDVNQNLHAALSGGLFGGLTHGAVEIAPHVLGLFRARGIDTTPQADPRPGAAMIAPMTSDHVAMNAADHAQYQHLLQTGSVDDIKQFFQGRNGPQPSWSDVNTWVEHRDGSHAPVNGQPGAPNPEMQPDFDYNREYNQHAEAEHNERQRGAVEDHINSRMAGWSNAPNVEVVHSPADIADPDVRAQALRDDHPTTGEAPGAPAFYGPDGTMRVYSGRVKSPEQANAILYHEGLGHFGLAEKFGDKLDSVLQSMLERNVNGLSSATDTWMSKNKGAYNGNRLRAAEEVLARQSEKGPLPKSWRDAVGHTINQFGRKMGLKLAYSDGEVRHILAMAHDAVINGKPSARANGFHSADSKFMYVGRAANTFPHEEARKAESGQYPYHHASPEDIREQVGIFKGADGDTRYEITDHESHMRNWDSIPADGVFDKTEGHALPDVLHHPDLYAAYPELKQVKVTKRPAFLDLWGQMQGSFNPRTGILNISPHATDPHSTALHEIQHWIQEKEGWSPGGNQDTVRLDNNDAVNKLKGFYDRRLNELSAEGANDTPTGRSMLKVLQRKMDMVHDILHDDSTVGEIYRHADAARTKAVTLKVQIKRLETADQTARQAWRDKFDEIGKRYDALVRERRYPEAHVLHQERMALPKSSYAELDDKLRPIKEQLKAAEHSQQLAETQLNGIKGQYSDVSHDLYRLIAGEREARDTQARMGMNDQTRSNTAPYSSEGIQNHEVIHTPNYGFAESRAHFDELGREKTSPDHLDEIDRLKQDPRFWSDPEFRRNVIEMARTRFDPETAKPAEAPKYRTEAEARATGNKFMRRDPDEEGYGRLPITDDDILIARRLHGDIQRDDRIRNGSDKFNRPMGEEYRANQEDRLAREYGDIPFEHLVRISEDFKNMNVGDTHPDLQRSIKVFDTRTNEVVYTAKNRREAMKYIDAHPDNQSLGVDRYGTTARYMRAGAFDEAHDPDYHSEDPERVYRALEENYHKSSISWDETQTEALKNGISPSTIKALKGRDPGELASRVYRLGAATNLADAKLRALEERIGTPQETQGDKVAYIKALADFNFIAPRFKGETSEAGRALNIAKAFPQYSNATLSEIAEALREHGEDGLAHLAEDPDSFNKFVRALQLVRGKANTNPLGVQTMLRGVQKPYWEQYLTTFHMNMMLSALSTHVKAPVDMMTGISRNVIEKMFAIPVGTARNMYQAMTGKPITPGVEVGELIAHVAGIMRAVTSGEVYKATLHATKKGDSSYVDAGGRRVPTNFANQFGATSNPRIPGISKPTDLISAQDTYFRSIEMNAQLETQGYREARQQLGPKASTHDVMTLGNHLAANPTPRMIRDAFDATNRTLLLNSNPLNRLVDRARTYRPGMNFGERLGAFVASNLAPFIRVESNSLINRIVQRSPLALLDPYTLKQIKGGGAGADIAVTKIAYGTVLLGMYWMAAEAGKNYLTGNGSGNVDQYKEDIASGWRPSAVHENGTYNTGGQLGMSVNPLDMHNRTAQMVASMRQAYDGQANQGQVGMGLTLAFGSAIHSLAEQSWVSDIEPAMSALMAHGQEGQSVVSRFASQEASSWMPNLVSQAARLHDPVQRDTNSDTPIIGQVGNTLAQAVPGLREGLPVKYSVYGDPLANGASYSGVHTWIPGLSGNGTTETHDLAERELDRLNSILPDIKSHLSAADAAQLPTTLITPVQHTIKLEDGTPKRLTPQEFETYQQRAGKDTVDYIRQEMTTPEWQAMSDQEKVEEVRSTATDMKANAREALFEP